MARRQQTAERRRRRIFRRRKPRAGVFEGVVRIDARTKDLLHRLRPGEIAIVMHDDLDQVAAEGLVERGAIAVVNCHRSITGRYPNGGPLVLERAGVPLIDQAGEGLLEKVREGDIVRIDGDALYRGDELVGAGELLGGRALEDAMTAAQQAISEELERFVRNTTEYLDQERDLVLRGAAPPDLRTRIGGHPAVVVVRGNHFRKDLQLLRGYIKGTKPVLIAVDGAADAMLEEKMKPDVIIGDMDSVSTDALVSGAEIIVHAYPDGRAPGLERVQGLGVEPLIYASAGTSEDIALLLAFDNGADLIVAVGAHDNLVEFLDKGRGGMASTFVTRLKVGPKLVDAKGVSRLYHAQVRVRDMMLLVGSALFAMLVAAAASPSLRLFVRYTLDSIQNFFQNIF
jgi:uncharacterized membrane-anchored protein